MYELAWVTIFSIFYSSKWINWFKLHWIVNNLVRKLAPRLSVWFNRKLIRVLCRFWLRIMTHIVLNFDIFACCHWQKLAKLATKKVFLKNYVSSVSINSSNFSQKMFSSFQFLNIYHKKWYDDHELMSDLLIFQGIMNFLTRFEDQRFHHSVW